MRRQSGNFCASEPILEINNDSIRNTSSFCRSRSLANFISDGLAGKDMWIFGGGHAIHCFVFLRKFFNQVVANANKNLKCKKETSSHPFHKISDAFIDFKKTTHLTI